MRKPGSRRSRQRRSGDALAAVLALLASAAADAQCEELRPFKIVGDAIPAALTETAGDATRGWAIILDRKLGACLLCHTGPFSEEKFQGTLAPDLTGAGSRWSEGELRLRLVDPRRLNPQTIMPAYYRVEGLTRVAQAWRGKPVLTAQQIEDVVTFLSSLRD